MSQSESVRTASSSRRTFLKGSAAVVGGAMVGTLALERAAHAAGDDTLRIALIGCGGRGTGATANALKADKAIKLIAMADAFEDRLASSHNILARQFGDKVEVPKDRQFVGFDAYKQVMDLKDVDVVLLCTSPHFRPIHYAAAVDAGKHLFVEKPVAVDAPGLRSVLETNKKAKESGLAVVSGLCYRYDLAKRETIDRIHRGDIGDVMAMQVTYNTGTLWHRGRKPAWSEMEFQMRNWLYFTWLSGDHNCEQHVHSLDKAQWVLGDIAPQRCYGVGGRQVRTDKKFGNIYDHHSVCYEYPGGAKLFSQCRQMANCSSDVSDHVFGTKGRAELMSHSLAPLEGERWRYRGGAPNMYDQEHVELYASIRAGKPLHNGHYMAYSTMLAIMGRMATYTGQTITWDMAINSQEDLSPKAYAWGDAPEPVVAMPHGPFRQIVPHGVVFPVGRRDNDGFRLGMLEQHLFESLQPWRIQMFDHFHHHGHVKPVEAFVFVHERAVEQ